MSAPARHRWCTWAALALALVLIDTAEAQPKPYLPGTAAASFASMVPLAIAFYLFGRHMVAGLTLGTLK